MSYVGGKHRLRKPIADLIVRECKRLGVREVWEPFCGGLHITAELGRRGYAVHASDLSEPAVVYYRAISMGWKPPATLAHTQWQALKDAHKRGERHPMISFAGFSCSMNAIYFTAFDPSPRRFAPLRRRVRACHFASLRHRSYTDADAPAGSVIYCDPPYTDTDVGAYRSLSKEERRFDHAVFWQWCRDHAARGSTVLVSEYSAPDDVACAFSKDHAVNTGRHSGAASTAVERVFILRGPDL
jgi:site-specific DNA-adenine methylase